MKRMGWMLLLLAALLLAGCAQRTAPTEAPTEPPEETAASPDAEPPEVENNGGYYVRVGDTIYFRRYGKDATVPTAVFGQFTATWNVVGESELVAYDPATGELTALYTESGFGPLWYGDGGFYLSERLGGTPVTVWYAADGSGAKELCPGEVLGMTDGGLLAVEGGETDAAYVFYRHGEQVGVCRTELGMEFAGLTEDGLFMLSSDYDYDAETATHTLWQITPAGALLRLGDLTDDESTLLCVVRPDRFLAHDGKVVVGLGYYSGTGMFLDFAMFAEATVGQAESLRLLEPEGDGTADDEPLYPVLNDDGTLGYVPALPHALRIGLGEMGALELWEDGAWQLLSEHFAPERNGGWGMSNVVQHMDYVDGAAYVTVASVFASPADNIGWRDASQLLAMTYLRVERSGEARELACVERDAELYGNVWFVEEASAAIWQQLTSEDGEGWFDVPNAYAVPIRDDAVWDDLAFDGVTGLLPYDYGEGEADYWGYPVPDTEPAGELTLVLDRDGYAKAVLRKDPDAALNIFFDVPEAELSGAKETLPLVRRAGDEDTPWFWTRLCSLEDGLRVRVERTPKETTALEDEAMEMGVFIPGETLYDGTLNRGEFLALRASLPWHPELRVTVDKDGKCGSYVFGEDNDMHFETEDGVHPQMTLATYPPPEAEEYGGDGLRQTLTGTWLYRDPDTGAADALLYIDDDGTLTLNRGGETATLHTELSWLYNDEWQSPDLLCLTSDDPALTALGFENGAGDYGIELYRTDGEELLRLTQRNNGDGALGALLPDGDGAWRYDFVFSRADGVAGVGVRRYGLSFPAVVARYDGDAGRCWLREAEIIDSDGQSGDVWRAREFAPCLSYHITAEAAKALQGAYPMALCRVTTDGSGKIVALDAIE